MPSLQPDATLGLRQWGTGHGSKIGFGEAHPSKIHNGGDPGGMVLDIVWSSWGGPTASGTGEGLDAPQTGIGWVSKPARIRAFDLTTCDGHPAYRRVIWWFPSDGDTFDTAIAKSYEPYDLCTGEVLSHD